MNELKQIALTNTLPKINRELSWLAFNERVLLEALDANVPVLERLRFLGIYSNNLDEFFRVRVGTLHRLISENHKSTLNYDPKSILKQIYQKLKEDERIFASAYDDIKKDLKQQHIEFLSDTNLNELNRNWCHTYFKKNIRRGVTPLIFKEDLKFPNLKDKSIYLAIKMVLINNQVQYSLIEVPTEFYSRFIEVPSQNASLHQVILLEDLIRLNLDEIFKVFDCKEITAYTIKITRDAELDLDNDFSKSDLDYLSESIKQRRKGIPVRFIADKKIPKDLLNFILQKSQISRQNVVLSGKYHNFKDFMNFPDFGIANLKYPAIESIPNKKIESSKTILNTIEKNDVLLFYPYNSFDYLLDLLREASIDPAVEEIKMSLYRLSRKSQIVHILSNAVKNGKKVTVIMEITARFDEENNIFWANEMKEDGIRIIYGHPELKVHSKLVYIKKNTRKGIIEYCNISTGNFNEVTAHVYSDLSLFTINPVLTSEVAKVFRFLETKKTPKFNSLLISPFTMRSGIIEKIKREINHKLEGKKAHIILKVNSLVDDEIIDLLYEAKQVGVKVQLIIRGICCLCSDIEDNKQIHAVSIIDKFLEHARVYYFYNADEEECYISSADIMVRNLDFRVEVAAPIFDKLILKKILKFLKIQLRDNQKSRIHNSNMSNARYSNPKQPSIIRSQIDIYNWLLEDSQS